MAFFKDDDGDKGGGSKAGGNFLTKDMGPLPVWGWAALAVASIFLFRMMMKPKADPNAADANANQTPVPYPTGGVGGVFLIPSGVNAPPSQQNPPPATTPGAGTTPGLFDWLIRTNQQLLSNAYQERIAAGDAQPYPAQGMAFLQQTHVASQLGLPHVISEGGVGYVYNPATGQKVLADTFNAMPEAQREALTVGNAGAWSTI